jgi:hypothetical protein
MLGMVKLQFALGRGISGRQDCCSGLEGSGHWLPVGHENCCRFYQRVLRTDTPRVTDFIILCAARVAIGLLEDASALNYGVMMMVLFRSTY